MEEIKLKQSEDLRVALATLIYINSEIIKGKIKTTQ